MSAFLYTIALQWKLDIRSKALFITCYIVPLMFFALMGGIFTSINPEMKGTLIQSMCVMGVTMGAMLGMPPSIIHTYASDVKKAYIVGGVPLYVSIVAMFISTFVNLMIMSTIIFIVSPIAFDAALPINIPLFFVSLAIFIIVSLGVGCILGLAIKSQVKLTMLAQVIFLPSIMLSGIMFPANMLPKALETVGKIFPASWGYLLMLDNGFEVSNLLPLLLIFIMAILICTLLFRKQQLQ